MADEVTVEQCVKWYEDFENNTTNTRALAETCQRFYDGEQWTPKQIADLEHRQQPPVVYNRIARKVNFLVGGEIASRVDPRALPRTPSEDDGASESITDALRYAADSKLVRFEKVKTALARDVFVEGFSAAVCEVVVREAKDQWSPASIDLRLTHVPWDRFYWDPHSRRCDYLDAKYLGVVTWLEEDEANDRYPGHKDIITSAVTSGASVAGIDAHPDRPSIWYDTSNHRIMVCEVYWREKRDGKYVWRYAHHVRSEFLIKPSDVPFVDECGDSWCPVIALSGHVTADNERYGNTKHFLDPQREINKRRSLGMHFMQQNRVITERGAIGNVHEFQTQLAKPDGVAEIEPGRMRNGTFQVLPNTDVTAGQLAMEQEAKNEINTIGPSADALNQSDASSGIALLRRKELANTELRYIFDLLEDWQHRVFVALWWLIRQYWTDEKWLRVTDDAEKNGFRFTGINRRMTVGQRIEELVQKDVPIDKAVSMVGMQKDQAAQWLGAARAQAQATAMQELAAQGIDPRQAPPEAQQAAMSVVEKYAMALLQASPQWSAPFIANNVAEIDVDIVIDTMPDVAVMQEEQFQMLVEMASKGFFNPVATPPPVMKMVIEASQLRDKKRLVANLEELNNPKQDPAMAQAAQQQMALQIRGMQAQLERAMAEIDKIKAETAKTIASIPGVEASGKLDEARAVMQSIEAGRASVPNQTPETGVGR
jgi:hypothetical protein